MTTFTVFCGASAPMVARGVNQCRMLAFAHKYPGWHTLGKGRANKRAADALTAKGYLERSFDMFRIRYPR